MKDIVDYFNSPTNINRSNSSENQEQTSKKAYEHSEINENNAENSSKESPIFTNRKILKSSVQGKVNVKKKRKKTKTRKPSDPLVKDITELLSNSLHFISSDNSSPEKHFTATVFDETTSEKSDNMQKNEDSLDNTVENKNKTLATPPMKANAFKFLMESRNKIIGTNSPGKEVNKDVSCDIKPNKEKLAARKNLLKSWSDKKGASKRKHAEEDLDDIINKKLDNRAKRLKKLLKADNKQKENYQMVKKRSQHVKRISISSNSEDSNNDLNNEINLERVVQAEFIEINSDESNFPQHKSDFEDESNGSNKYEIIEKFDISPNKLASTSNSKSKDRKSLLKFFEVVNTTKDIEQTNSEKQLEAPKAAKNMNKSKHYNHTKSRNIISESREKVCEKGHNSDRKVQKKKLQEKQNNKINPNSVIKKKFLNKDSRTDNQGESNHSKDIIKDENISANILLSEESEIPKVNRELKIKKKIKSAIMNNENPVIESNGDSFGVPRRLRSWKMKIKINLDEERETDKNFEPVRKYIYVHDSSDDDVKEIKLKKNCDELLNDAIKMSLPDEELAVTKSCKTLKIAPLFIKAPPKPKIDPNVLEAKKKFLMSGMPLSLKKTMERQQGLEDKEYDIFPSISHVQQKCNSTFWDVPKPDLKLKEFSPLREEMPVPICNKITTAYINKKLNIQSSVEKFGDINILVNKIKKDNPEYPVFKCYRHISEKNIGNSVTKVEKKSSSKKRNSKKRQQYVDTDMKAIEQSEKIEVSEYAMWTEKYKPKSSEDIIGNTEAVKNLKNWLETWMNFSKEINSRKRRRNSSSSEFETTDDSRDSGRLPGNTMVLGGPCGSGKTSAVYAICNELGFNVIELNASSKRTGKRLILELQEATQSHQVQKTDSAKLQNFLQTPKNEKSEAEEVLSKRKMSILLVEDIDIVFEQDEGFISSLTQLILTSKRPIILTTTDFNSIFVQKLLHHYEHIQFLPLNAYRLATWLQILCVVEGIYVDREDIGNLLEINKGDVRKTILELQFWVQSGGEIVKYEKTLKIDYKRSSGEEKLVQDDDTKLEESSINIGNVVHKNCIRSFEIFDNDKPFLLPYYWNLGIFWWNIPNLLSVPTFAQERCEKLKLDNKTTLEQVFVKQIKSSFQDKQNLSQFNKLYEVVCSVDVLFRKVNYFDRLEPEVTNHDCHLRDSMELTEKMDSYIDVEFVHEITHYLVNGCITEYNERQNLQPNLDIAVPNKAEKRWRAKIHACEDTLQEALSYSTRIDRKSTVLDYVPTLREITRSENRRAANTMKRGNRFRHYLKNLGVNCNQNTSQVAGNILKEIDFL